jgi:hypothetical protein
MTLVPGRASGYAKGDGTLAQGPVARQRAPAREGGAVDSVAHDNRASRERGEKFGATPEQGSVRSPRGGDLGNNGSETLGVELPRHGDYLAAELDGGVSPERQVCGPVVAPG